MFKLLTKKWMIKMKKNNKNLLIGLGITLFIIVLISILQLSGMINFLSIVGYESVYKENYGHICCEEGAYEPPYIKYADDKPTYKCDSYTDECRITMNVINPPLWNLNRVLVEYDICNLDGTNCITQSYIGMDGDTKTISIDYGKKINFIDSSFTFDPRAYYKYLADYRIFYIQGEENGKVYTSETCELDYDLKGRVLAGGLNELAKVGANRCQNYIIDYILVETKTYDYQFKEVVCQAREIYEIDEIDLLDGSTRKIQGNRIKGVECCPTEANCDEDTFKFKEDVIKECTYDSHCPNAGNPVAVTGTSYVEYECVSGMCKQSSEVDVQCTNNAICVNLYNKPNMVCLNFKCKESEEWSGHCGDGKCESIIGETPTSCPDDCAGNGEGKFKWNTLYLLPILLALGMSMYMGWKKREETGKYEPMAFIIWGILGALIGGAIAWVINNWFIISLIAFLGSGLTIGLILLIGGIPLFLAIIGMMRK